MNDHPRAADPAGQFGPATYADWRQSSLGEIVEDLEQRLVLRLAGDLQGRSVLDVGCGDGTLTLAFARGGAKSVVGCDIDPRMISRAAGRAAQENEQIVRYLVGDATRLPFVDQTFDLVTTITVLAFVADAEGAVREMARVLKPGGMLVIGELGKWSFWAARRRVRGWLGSRMWRAAAFRTAPRLRALVEAARLRVEHVSGAIFFPPYLPLASRLARWDATLGERTTLGAAFIAVKSRKE